MMLAGVIQFAALATTLFMMSVSLMSLLVWPGIRSRLASLAPASRAGVLTGIAMAPMLGAVLLTLAAFGPKLLSPFGFEDHCHAHSGHDHLCLVHAATPDGLFAWSGVVVLIGLIIVLAASHLPAVIRVRRARAALEMLRAPGPLDQSRTIVAKEPFAATIGYLRPGVFVSSALVQALEPDDLAVVQAHEEAHRVRLDPLRLAVARAMSLVHFPGVRSQMISDLALSCEQAADESAALAVGDRLRVATALLAVERIMGTRIVPGSSIAGEALSARVESLGNSPGNAIARSATWIAMLVLLISLGLVSGSLHHATEIILSLLTR